MKIIKGVIIGVFLLFNTILFAQQESILAWYPYQMSLVNPAYVGVDAETFITSSYRKQWIEIEGAPEKQAVSFGAPLKENLSIGLSIVNDKVFIEQQLFVGIDFSYKLKVAQGTDVYMGIKAGGSFYTVNTSRLQSYNTGSDPALVSISQFNPNMGVGALLKNKNYFVSFSITKLLNTAGAVDANGYATAITDNAHFYLSGGHDFSLNPDIVLKPFFMFRYLYGTPLSCDLNMMFQFFNKFEIGALYRNVGTFGGMVDFNITENIMFGGAYELSNRYRLGGASSSYEFLLRIKL